MVGTGQKTFEYSEVVRAFGRQFVADGRVGRCAGASTVGQIRATTRTFLVWCHREGVELPVNCSNSGSSYGDVRAGCVGNAPTTDASPWTGAA